jgi:hypothetical protein
MKKFALLIVLMILAMACISEEEPQTPPSPPTTTSSPTTTTPPPPTPAPTTPPTTAPSTLEDVFTPIYKDKMWSTYVINTEGQETQMIWKMFDDGDIFVHEFETEDAVTQAWLTKEFKQIKAVIKDEDEVYCIDTSTFINPTETYSPEKYENLYVEKETTYTMPTGKTVKVFIVTDGKNEIWFSEEVPFSVVKVIVDGELAMVLIDFGFDAERKISREEGEQCIPIPTP